MRMEFAETTAQRLSKRVARRKLLRKPLCGLRRLAMTAGSKSKSKIAGETGKKSGIAFIQNFVQDTGMTVIILQARLDSSRLPGKALLPLDGEPLVFHVMEALSHIPAVLRILACPEDSVDPFTAPAASAGFEVFAGSKYDVLGRFCAAIRHFGLDGEGACRIIRATGDNPFVFCDAAEAINREAAALDADYAGFAALPYGAGVESVAISALLRAEKEAETPYHREHVCPYLYENGGLFTLHRPLAPAKWRYPSMRLTVDTAADYGNAKLLYRELVRSAPPEKRVLGESVIGAYNRIFPPPPLRSVVCGGLADTNRETRSISLMDKMWVK